MYYIGRIIYAFLTRVAGHKSNLHCMVSTRDTLAPGSHSPRASTSATMKPNSRPRLRQGLIEHHFGRSIAVVQLHYLDVAWRDPSLAVRLRCGLESIA